MRSWSSRILDFQLKNFATKLQPAKYGTFTCTKVHVSFLSTHLFNHLYVNHGFIPQSIRPFCRP